MSLLRKHQKKEIRFEKGDLKIFEPTDIIKEEMFEILKTQNIKIENEEVKGEVDFKFARFILRECTSLQNEVDEYTDEQLDEMFVNGDRDLILFYREIKIFIQELIEDLLYAQSEEYSLINQILTILNSKSDKATLENKFNKLMKKQGMNLTMQDMVLNADNPEKISELIKTSKKTYNKGKK